MGWPYGRAFFENEARRAARTPEQVAEEEARAREMRAINVLSFGRRRRPSRPDVPRELTDDAILEQLALLGADIGPEGEALLRRVATDAPHQLAPAVEEMLAGPGVAGYSSSLLIDLIEAYYIDEQDAYDGLRDDGIRRHHWRGPVTPLAAYYRGPFLALFRADLRGGVACLNRLLNHAARPRVQILRRPRWDEPEPDGDQYFLDLAIAAEPQRYVGDGQIWFWYRGTGVGPYPCKSALPALEFVCDQCLAAGLAPGVLVRILLDGCANLAMPALIVGILVRHLERVDTELDSFLTEPAIWHLEFARTIQEHSTMAARNSLITNEDRRSWDLRNVAARLTPAARGDRVDALRVLGRRLVARALEFEGHDESTADADATEMSEEIAAVHGWGISLDIDSYKFTEAEGGYLVEQVVDEAVT